MNRNLSFAIIFLATSAVVLGDTVVVPNAQANAAGNSPIHLGNSPVRIQEVIGSGQFPGAIMISAMRLRAAPGTGIVNSSGPSAQLTLSTTQAYPNTSNGHTLPSSTYANNVGPDAVVVFRGSFTLSSPGCAAPGPCAFDLVVPFSSPFFYDPTKGRLLVDLVTPTPSGTVAGSLDAVLFGDSTTSTVAVIGTDPNLPTGFLTLGGFVLQFEFAAAGPTPSITSVVNTADFSTHLSPGVLATIFGTNFGSGPASSATVLVGGKSAAVLSVTANQMNVQIPVDAATGATTMTVAVNNVTSAAFNLTLDSYAPALFTANGLGTGLALVLAANSSKVTAAAPANAGDTLSAFADGLGPTTPPTPTGGTAKNPTATTPTLTVGGAAAQILYSGGAGNVGLSQINFKVPLNLQGTLPLVLSIGGKTSTANVTLPLVGITSVTSNGGFGSAGIVSPGSIVSISANGIGSTDQIVGFPATAFQGNSILFNGTPAPLFHLVGSANQIDLLVPYELPTSGVVNLQLKTPAATLPNFPVTMAAATPGLYTIQDPSNKNRLNVIAQFNATAWLAMPDSMAAALKIPGNCSASNISPLSLCGQPASAGDYLVLYTTGLGKATPNGDPNGAQLKTGDIPPVDGSVLYQTVETPTVTVGGIAAKVVFSGIAPGFPGLYQVDFQVPVGVSGDDVLVVVTIGGRSDTRTIAIRAAH